MATNSNAAPSYAVNESVTRALAEWKHEVSPDAERVFKHAATLLSAVSLSFKNAGFEVKNGSNNDVLFNFPNTAFYRSGEPVWLLVRLRGEDDWSMWWKTETDRWSSDEKTLKFKFEPQCDLLTGASGEEATAYLAKLILDEFKQWWKDATEKEERRRAQKG